ITASVATAFSPCGYRACSDEVAASGLSRQARGACLRQVIADCRAGLCSCTGESPPCSCVCGDGLCGPSEDCSTCPQDCGPCPTIQCCGSPMGAFVGQCVVETMCDANHPQNFGLGSCSPNPCPTTTTTTTSPTTVSCNYDGTSCFGSCSGSDTSCVLVDTPLRTCGCAASPTCQSSAYPTCGGDCPAGSVCQAVKVGVSTGCRCVVGTCASGTGSACTVPCQIETVCGTGRCPPGEACLAVYFGNTNPVCGCVPP